jgi:hypothetical protein
VEDTLCKINLADITMIADTLRSRGIQWLVINFPVSPNYRTTAACSPFGPSWQTEHDVFEQLRFVESNNRYFHFYDANIDGNHDYSDTDAIDNNHLSASGAEKLTKRVDSIIHSF